MPHVVPGLPEGFKQMSRVTVELEDSKEAYVLVRAHCILMRYLSLLLISCGTTCSIC